jgi:hypothetical protein
MRLVKPPPGMNGIVLFSSGFWGSCCTGDVYAGIGKDSKLCNADELIRLFLGRNWKVVVL